MLFIPILAMVLFMVATVIVSRLAADARHKRLTGVWESLARERGWQLVKPYPEAHLTGVLDGVPIEASNVVVGMHKGAPIYRTRLRARIELQLGGLSIERRGSLARALAAPGASSLDPEFDRAFTVRGGGTEKVQRILTMTVRRALIDLDDALPGASIQDGELVWAERELDDPRAIERSLGLLAATAAALRS